MLKRVMLSGVLCAGLAASGATAEDALVTFKVLSPATALELARATLQNCRDQGYQVSVAVVDRFGTVQVLLRDQLAGIHTPETARRKASTAVSFRTDTLELSELVSSGEVPPGIRQIPGVLVVGGGVRVLAAGSIVGGVGVSGAPGGDLDEECARAGIEAIDDKIQF